MGNIPVDLPGRTGQLVEPVDLPPSAGSTTEAESRAKTFGVYADTWARLAMVVVIAVIFVGLNYRVMAFVETVFASDLSLLKATPTSGRVVTTPVLMALIGATVVQSGVAVIAILSYLFPKNRQNSAQ